MKRIIYVLLVLGAVTILWVAPVYAFITAPTSITFSSVTAFRELSTSGDIDILFHYSMPYASDNYTSTPASESIMFRVIATDNLTVLQTGVPYVYPYFESNGYGEGVGSFHFTSTDNITWGDAVTLQIVKLPAYFSPSETKSYTMTSSNYVTATTQEANRLLLKDYILLECDKLAASYSATGVILKATSDSGIVLSSYGENYFRGAIPGLQALCPELFFIQLLIPEAMPTTAYDMSLQTTYTNRLVGTDMGAGFDRLGAIIGVGGAFAAAALNFVLTFALCIYVTRKGWGTEIGLLGGALMGIGLMLIVGDIVFTLVMVGSLVAAIGLVWIFMLKRA